MQQTRARASRWAYEGPLARRVSVIVLAAATGIGTGCHDAATDPTSATTPTFAVSHDGMWLVNSLADPGDGECTSSECTLREAIAVAQAGDHITFKSNMSGTIGLTAGTLVIGKILTIDGPGADRITVSGQNASTVFQIGDVDPVALATISGLTITGGNNLPTGMGGGIRVLAGARLTLIGSLVTGNTASTGAGIYSEGTLTVVGSTIAANRASYSGGGIVSDGVLTVSRSTVSGNRTDFWRGGGILVLCSVFCGTGPSIRSSTITANDASGDGGGVYLLTPTTLSNTIIAGNRVNGDPAASTADCWDTADLDLGYNVSTLGTGCNLTGSTDVILQLPSQVFTSVLEPLLADNGSPRKTHALIERGYAVDAGYCPGESGDQRGFPRPFDDLRMPNALDGCDIGAFEWQPADTKTKGPKP